MTEAEPSTCGRRRGRRSAAVAVATMTACTLAVSTLSPEPTAAQVVPPPGVEQDSATVAAGERYGASGIVRSLAGNGYRDLWTTPIRVPVVRLTDIGGGLTPIRLGGGVTTRTLHLDGADGRRYVFRSVDKTPSDLLEDLGGSIVEGVIQDQMSSFHPSGALVVARLFAALDIPTAQPRLMVVADDPALGDFRDTFAGLLVLVEERPDDGPDGTPGFAGSRRIIQTDDLFDELEEDPANRIDAGTLLRVRLVDLLVGDRDRSHNNHLWARYDRDGGGFDWRVIPRDRDQAFVHFDGRLMSVARRYERRFVRFDDAFPNVFGLTRNAWDIDRTLLVGLSREAWDEAVADVVSTLTDDVIRDAVAAMPPEHQAIVGDGMRQALMLRRDHLAEAADELYGIVFDYADVHTTDAAETLEATRHDDGSVTVSVTTTATPVFHRTFRPDETSEVRVYLHGGADVVRIAGEGPDDILVRIIGGGGRDRFDVTEADAGDGFILYDGGDGTTFPNVGRADIRRHDAPRPYSWWFEEERVVDWGSLTKPLPRASYDDDRGLVIMPGVRHRRFGFLKHPHRQLIELRVGWAFRTGEPLLEYRHVFQDFRGPLDFEARVKWSGVELLNFYGYGNTTTTDRERDFYRVDYDEFSVSLLLGVGDGDRSFVAAGPAFLRTALDTVATVSLLAEQDPYGAGDFTYAGFGLSGALDDRDVVGTPKRGVRLQGGGAYYPSTLDADRGSFGFAQGQISGYLSPPGGNPVLAVRAAGKRVWGDYPVTQAAYLGGPRSLRGVPEQRYAGDTSMLGSAEIRVQVGSILFPLPADVGFYLLLDAGRVLYDGSPADRWHWSRGGGLWFSLVNGSAVLRTTIARSSLGSTKLDAGIGFAY